MITFGMLRQSPGRRPILLFVLLLFCGLTGCASVFSQQVQDRALPRVPFRELLEKGEVNKGDLVILGGYILEARNEPGRSVLSILQAPLDSQDKPKSRDLSEGRFLMRTERFLDPEIYSKGRKISVAGTVLGIEPQPLGDGSYGYLVIDAQEVHLWPKEEPYSRRYDPFYDHWYYPWYPWYPYRYRPYPWWFW